MDNGSDRGASFLDETADEIIRKMGYGDPASKPSKPRKPKTPPPEDAETDLEDADIAPDVGSDWLAENRHAVLKVRPGRQPELADSAERILVKHDGNIYQRSGFLVRITTTRAETVHGIKRPAGNTIIVSLDPEYLLDRLNRQIGWLRYNERKGDWVPLQCAPPPGEYVVGALWTVEFQTAGQRDYRPDLAPGRFHS